MAKIRTYCSAGAVDAEGNGIVNPDGSVACTANPFGGTGWAYLPDGIRYSQVDYDRTRERIALAGQYESPTGDVRATVQFIKSSYDNAWLETVSHAKLEGRSEEHTSELQSLMRNSYAAFCLKKNTN